MNMQVPEWVKTALWGAVAGVIVFVVIGFTAGWVVTSGTAEDRAERQAEKAVLAALTPICVAQFRTEPKPEQTTYLTALQKEDFWLRADYVEKQGWATMPGANAPNNEVAEACAAKLLEIAEKSAAKPAGAS